MQDIKSLYTTAKISGNRDDISAYMEATQGLLERNDPLEYVTNLEYIITTSVGVKSFEGFMNEHGLPIELHERVVDILESSIKDCEIRRIDASLFENVLDMMYERKNNYVKTYALYETCKNEDRISNYIDAYYKHFPMFKEHAFSKIDVSPLLNKYGNAVMADILLYNNQFANINECYKSLMEYSYTESCDLWIHETSSEFRIDKSIRKSLYESTIIPIVNDRIKSKNIKLQESIILGEPEVMEFTEGEVDMMMNLISFKEYMGLCTCDESYYEYVFSLYECLNGIFTEDNGSDELVNYGSIYQEFIGGARKTGKIPGYITRHHDANYGEQDTKKSLNKDIDDDLRRPSADIMSDNNIRSDLDNISNEPPTSNISDDIKQRDGINSDVPETSVSKPPNSHQVNNIYYYNYTNSNNKNTNSNNKSNDDNSRRTFDYSKKSNDYSRHSSVSNMGNSGTSNTGNFNSQMPSDSRMSKNESYVGHELDNLFDEAVGDADDGKPKSDHPVKDFLTDIDRTLVDVNQKAKKAGQDAFNAGKALVKPVKRTNEWINKVASDWKDISKNKAKEKLTDPKERNILMKTLNWTIRSGSLLKAGLLLNPIFWGLNGLYKHNKSKSDEKLRNEIYSELKAELAIIKDKIELADRNGDTAEKYKLMRFEQEFKKKLARVALPARASGSTDLNKVIPIR